MINPGLWKLRFITIRWLWILVYAAIGAITVFALFGAIDFGQRYTDWVFHRVSDNVTSASFLDLNSPIVGWWWNCSVFAIVSLAMAYTLVRLGSIPIARYCDCWQQLRYAPSWVGGVFGSIALWLTLNLTTLGYQPSSTDLLITFAFIPTIAFLVLPTLNLIRDYIRNWKAEDATPPQPHDQPATNAETFADAVDRMVANPSEIIKWAQNEKPIQRVEDDTLQNAIIARRIVDQIIADLEADNPPANHGLRGRRGSGKSSIMRMVQLLCAEVDQTRDRVWFVNVSGWGLDDGLSAVDIILRHIVAEIGKHVDTLALAGLPTAFRRALSSSGHWLATMLAQALHDSDVETPLKTLSKVLRPLGVKVVLVLEDIERNRETTQTDQIEAFIDRLRADVPEIITILVWADDTGSTNDHPTPSLDFDRLCESTEVVPPLPREPTWRLTYTFAEYCRVKFDDIDPRPLKERDQFNAWSPLRELAASTHDHPYLELSVVELLRTPRILKRVLRMTWTDWVTLHGEVDIEQLIILNTLRAAMPEAYRFLREYRTRLRHTPDDSPAKEERRIRLNTSWKESADAWPIDDQTLATHARVLFASLDHDWSGQFRSLSRYNPPQGITAHFDRYWNRLDMRAFPPQDTQRDQQVLSVMKAWHKSDEGKYTLLNEVFSSPAFADRFSFFAQKWLNDDELNFTMEGVMDYGDRTLERLVQENIPIGPRMYLSHPGFLALGQIVKKLRLDDSKRYVAWALDKYTWALQINLQLATDVMHFLSTPDALADNPRRELHKGALANARDKLTTTCLATQLNCESPGVLKWLMRGKGETDQIAQPHEWQWLLPRLRWAARKNKVAIPLAIAVLISNKTIDPPHISWDEHNQRVEDYSEALKPDETFINNWLGGDGKTEKRIKSLKKLIRSASIRSAELGRSHPSLRDIWTIAQQWAES